MSLFNSIYKRHAAPADMRLALATMSVQTPPPARLYRLRFPRSKRPASKRRRSSAVPRRASSGVRAEQRPVPRRNWRRCTRRPRNAEECVEQGGIAQKLKVGRDHPCTRPLPEGEAPPRAHAGGVRSTSFAWKVWLVVECRGGITSRSCMCVAGSDVLTTTDTFHTDPPDSSQLQRSRFGSVLR